MSDIDAKQIAQSVRWSLEDIANQVRRNRPRHSSELKEHEAYLKVFETATVEAVPDESKVVARVVENQDGLAYSNILTEAMERTREIWKLNAEIVVSEPTERQLTW